MNINLDRLQALMAGPEDEHLEFKAASKGFSFDDLCRYCSAMANEGGGTIILGVSDALPREVLGTQAFPDVGGTKTRVLLDLVLRERPIPARLETRLRVLTEEGTVETVGRGRGRRYMLGQEYYAIAGKKGAYTRTRGLDRPHRKQLLLKHIQDSGQAGCKLGELMQVLPSCTKGQVQNLLRELRREGVIRLRGRTSAACWFSRSSP